MGKASRTKGVAGEREVAAVYRAAGFEVRGLEGEGDHLIVCKNGVVIASEVKRQERLKIPEWWDQTVAQSPPGAMPVLAFRQSRTEWKALTRLADLAALIGGKSCVYCGAPTLGVTCAAHSDLPTVDLDMLGRKMVRP